MQTRPVSLATALKTFALGLYFSFRRLSAAFRTLPDFLIVGTQKGGTTSLAAYLRQHPDIACSFGKEVHYFDGGVDPRVDNFRNGENWYRAHFPLQTPLTRPRVAFEATPMYLFHAHAAKRIHDCVPGAKIIILLRNPTDRAISHYRHSCSRGREDLPILEALQAEERRIGDALRHDDYSVGGVRYFSYKTRGLYADQIRRYRQYFDAERLLILDSAEMFENPTSILPEVLKFVGVDTEFEFPDLTARNVSRGIEPVPEDVYDYLKNWFRVPNDDLYELLGRDFGW